MKTKDSGQPGVKYGGFRARREPPPQEGEGPWHAEGRVINSHAGPRFPVARDNVLLLIIYDAPLASASSSARMGPADAKSAIRLKFF